MHFLTKTEQFHTSSVTRILDVDIKINKAYILKFIQKYSEPTICCKTTLIRRLKDSLYPEKYVVLYLSYSQLTPRWFYNGLLQQLGAEPKFYRVDAKLTCINNSNIFDNAIDEIYTYSAGAARAINKVCMHALLHALLRAVQHNKKLTFDKGLKSNTFKL